jgi:hypothetical protein
VSPRLPGQGQPPLTRVLRWAWENFTRLVVFATVALLWAYVLLHLLTTAGPL